MNLNFSKLRSIYLSSKKRTSGEKSTLPDTFAAGVKLLLNNSVTVRVGVTTKEGTVIIEKESSGQEVELVLSSVNNLVQSELDSKGISGVTLPTVDDLREY
jgi:hypothetical protein